MDTQTSTTAPKDEGFAIRFVRLDGKFDALDGRVGKLETSVADLGARVGKLEGKINALGASMDVLKGARWKDSAHTWAPA
jgi:hypothetical protein